MATTLSVVSAITLLCVLGIITSALNFGFTAMEVVVVFFVISFDKLPVQLPLLHGSYGFQILQENL